MADFNRGVVIISDVTQNGFDASQDWQMSATLESYKCDYAKLVNEAGQPFGATEPTTLDFSVRLHKGSHAKIIIYNLLQTYDNIRLTFLFDPTFNNRKRVTNYKDGIVVDGYVVNTRVEFRSAKDSQGRERQTILHVRLLLRSVVHISGMNAKKERPTIFVTSRLLPLPDQEGQGGADTSTRLTLSVAIDPDNTFQFSTVSRSKTQSVTFDHRKFIATLQTLSLNKAVYKPNQIKARLFLFPILGPTGFISREKFETVLRHKKATLTATDVHPVCTDYFVEEVTPTYTNDGKLYLDLTIYSPDYLLTRQTDCRSFVDSKLSDIAREYVASMPLPYDQAKTLALGNMAADMKHVVYNGQEHTFPYLVQYNESIYDFLRRNANRLGEFMYYENGTLNFGYSGNAYHAFSLELATPETEKKDYIKLCHAISYTDKTALVSFDTRYPGMSLGDLFKYGENSEEFYLITEINMQLQDSRPVWQVKAIQASKLRQVNVNGTTIWHIDVRPLPLIDRRGQGWSDPPRPPLPGPLKATVVDANDPLGQNRVRVRFDWQDENGAPTPWLLEAQDGTTPGAGSHMRHYVGEQVLTGFIDGDIERPYVIGSIQEKVPVKDNWESPIAAILRTPNGQSIQMSDGTGAGLTTFRTAMDPGIRAMKSLMPGRNPLGAFRFFSNKERPENKRFEGNVEIRDYYDFYQIKGSTNDRQVSISSPWGNTDFKAFTAVNITAPDGDIRISGKNVTIEATNNLKLISGTNIKKKDPRSTIATKAAAKVLLSFDKKGAIDFPMLRHILDKFIKPVEGLLELQSGRFLKLEAEGASTGYPTAEYKMRKVNTMADLDEQQWYLMGPAIAALISQSWLFLRNWFVKYNSSYYCAVNAKKEYDNDVIRLKNWSEIGIDEDTKNLDGTKVCNLYADLKDKLLNSDKLTEADMGFVDDLVGLDGNAQTTNCRARTLKEHDAILEFRKWARSNILMHGEYLQENIQRLKKCQFSSERINTDDVYHWLGLHPDLPRNYLDIAKQAFSEEKCASKSELYKTMTSLDKVDLTDDRYKKLADFSEPETAAKLTALKHLIALNILEGLGLKARKDNEVVAISSLVESEDDLVKNWNRTASYITYEYTANEKKENFVRKPKVSEQDIWGNAKSGQILVSSGKTYAIGKEIKAVSNTTQDLLKTEHLIEKLSSPIEQAMEVGAIRKL